MKNVLLVLKDAAPALLGVGGGLAIANDLKNKTVAIIDAKLESTLSIAASIVDEKAEELIGVVDKATVKLNAVAEETTSKLLDEAAKFNDESAKTMNNLSAGWFEIAGVVIITGLFYVGKQFEEPREKVKYVCIAAAALAVTAGGTILYLKKKGSDSTIVVVLGTIVLLGGFTVFFLRKFWVTCTRFNVRLDGGHHISNVLLKLVGTALFTTRHPSNHCVRLRENEPRDEIFSVFLSGFTAFFFPSAGLARLYLCTSQWLYH